MRPNGAVTGVEESVAISIDLGFARLGSTTGLVLSIGGRDDRQRGYDVIMSRSCAEEPSHPASDLERTRRAGPGRLKMRGLNATPNSPGKASSGLPCAAVVIGLKRVKAIDLSYSAWMSSKVLSDLKAF
jgi:hypothetical protein